MASDKVAVVTGCTGFVGAEAVKQLLEAGWTVRGTVRSDPATSSRVSSLKASLPAQHLSALSIHQADLLTPGAFDSIVKGATHVFHIASPFQIDVPNPAEDLIKPAVEGTRNVVLAAAKAKDSVKRVIITSSVAAVHDCHCKQPPKRGPDLYSEDDFNETSTLEKEAYWLSKVSAEKEAWALAKEHGLDLVTILPEFVMGPVLTEEAASTSLSAGFLKAFLEAPDGKVPSGTWIFSDVREVAAAHVLAATHPSASGRYIVASSEALDGKAVADALQAALPELALVAGEAGTPKYNLDNTKAVKELGLKLRPATESVVDMAKSLIALGFAKPKAK